MSGIEVYEGKEGGEHLCGSAKIGATTDVNIKKRR